MNHRGAELDRNVQLLLFKVSFTRHGGYVPVTVAGVSTCLAPFGAAMASGELRIASAGTEEVQKDSRQDCCPGRTASA